MLVNIAQMERHRTSAIYQAALSELRERHPKEFDRIYQRHLNEAGIGLYDRQIVKNSIVQAIRDLSGRNYEPMRLELIDHLGLAESTFQLYVRELEAEGRVIRPGAGSRRGYRLAKKRR